MKELILIFRDPKGLRHMVISGLLFFVVGIPFRFLMSLIPGVTEVRPANMLPVVLGLLWGPAGAWGTTIANALSDIFVSHASAAIWIPGAFINFFFAYLPYKLWYSISMKEEILPPTLGNVRQIIKYIYICFLDSLVVTAFLGMLFDLLGFQPYASGYLLLFFNNFDFSVILGIPVILLLVHVGKIRVWTPMETGKGISLEKIPDMVLWGMGMLGVFFYIRGSLGSAPVSEGGKLWMLAGLSAALLLYMTKPFLPAAIEKERLSGIPIRAKVVIGFLMLSVTFILVIGGAVHILLAPVFGDRWILWQYIFIVVGIALNFTFIVSLLFLHYVEQNITEPLETLSGLAVEFSSLDHRDTEKSREFLKDAPKIHTGDEVEELSGSFGKMMEDITDYVQNLETMTREKERIEAELNVATQIQMDMLPRIFPPFPERKEIDIFATMKPAREVGGDFYDFFLLDEKHLAVVVADVSGKGVPAALFMVIAKTLIKNQAQQGDSPQEVFSIVNNQLCEGNEAGLFVTAWLGVLDLESGILIFVNGGHNPPVVLHEGKAGLLKAPGFVLAGMEDIPYQQKEYRLSPGDKLFLYTDGVTEAENRRQEMYGEKRLLQVLEEKEGLDARKLVDGILWDVECFTAGAEQFDDITMVALVYCGGEQWKN